MKKRNGLIHIILPAIVFLILLLVIIIFVDRIGQLSKFSENISFSSLFTQKANIETSNWKNYENRFYNFSFKYPGSGSGYYFSYNDSIGADLFTDVYRKSGEPWFNIIWADGIYTSETDYIDVICAGLICSKIKNTTFGDNEYFTFDKVYDTDRYTTFIIKIPNTNSYIKFYDVNFDESVRNKILASLEFHKFEVSDSLKLKNSFFEFTYPSSWASIESGTMNSATVYKGQYKFSVLTDSASSGEADSVQERFDESNLYKYSSTSYYGDIKKQSVKKPSVEINGERAYVYQWTLKEDPYLETWIYLFHNGNVYEISMTGENQKELEKILTTFKFVE